jgi:hypothetical protein
MATYYIDQTLGATTNPGTVYTAPTKVMPTPQDGDVWLFGRAIGGHYAVFNPVPKNQIISVDTQQKNIRFGVYDPNTGSEVLTQISGRSRSPTKSSRGWVSDTEIADNYAIIDGGCKSTDLPNTNYLNSRGFNNAGAGQTYRGLVIQNYQSNAISAANAGAAGTRSFGVSYCVLSRIEVANVPGPSGGTGVSCQGLAGDWFYLTDSFVENVGEDGIWIAANNPTNPLNDWVVARNWYRNDGSQGLTMDSTHHCDCVQTACNSTNYQVINNYFDHQSLPGLATDGLPTIMQVFISGSGTPAVAGGLFQGNDVITSGSALSISSQPGLTTRGNNFFLIPNPAEVKKLGYVASLIQVANGQGIGDLTSNAGNGGLGGRAIFTENVVVSNAQGGSNGLILAETRAFKGGGYIGHNVFVGRGAGTKNCAINMFGAQSAGVIVENNVFTGFENALGDAGSITERNNAYYNNVRRKANSISGGSDLGVDATSLTLNAVQVAAAWDNEYRAKSGGLLVAAGRHSAYGLDRAGKNFYSPPSIGAFEVERARNQRL